MLLFSLLLACRPPSPTTAIAEPGVLGPFGVEQSAFFAARSTGRWFEVDLHLPSLNEQVVPESPVLVFVQGGSVARERYHWIAQALAAQGYAVLSPQYPSDLSILGSQRSLAALERARRLDDEGDPVLSGALGPRAGVLGHSLGGVSSANQWVRHPDHFSALAVLASYAADGDAVEERDAPVLFITGARDGSSTPEDVLAGAERFSQVTMACVQGMTHYDWTDDVTDKEREKEGTSASRPTAESREDAMAVLTAYMHAVLRDDESAWDALLEQDFPGVGFPGDCGG